MLARLRRGTKVRSYRRRTAVLTLAVLGALAVASWQIGWLGPGNGAARADVSPTPVTEVPSSLPAGGVQLQDGDIVLTPWASTPSGAMSADEAIAAARVFADSHPYPATALQADLTQPGSIPPSQGAAGSYNTVDHVPVWVVTFTSPTPTDVGQGGPGSSPVYVTHYSVAVDAGTGKFVLGFFEP
jgi:hypothetical protein